MTDAGPLDAARSGATADEAPFFDDVADAPPGAFALWRQAVDGTVLRVGVLSRGTAGTVLLFPGRTEYVEKYGPVARALQARGFAVLSIDWRGQGLSARLLPDGEIGHVNAFVDYQWDVAALLSVADELDLPEPRHLLAHSMGGAIGLRALMQGLPVTSVVFSAPMWSIVMAPGLRPIARALGAASRPFGLSGRYAPGTGPYASYIGAVPFEGNLLTGDPAAFARMRAQIAAHPDLALGGPSLQWLHEALREEALLAADPSPPVPCLCGLGAREAIVGGAAIRERMKRWPGGELRVYERGEHELMMERAEVRDAFLDAMIAHFEAHDGTRRESA